MRPAPFRLQAVCSECGKVAHAEESQGLISVTCFSDGCSQKGTEFRYEPPKLFASLDPMQTWPDALSKPEGNKPLPRCEVPDCVNQAGFIINERALCKDHMKQGPHPPSLRKSS